MKSLFICLALAAATTACSVKSERTVQAPVPAATTTTVATPATSTTYVAPAPAATTTTVVTR